MLEYLTSPEIWASFLTLSLLEIVLGIDNLVFLSVVTEKLPPEQAKKARRIGLAGALLMRIALLFMLSWIIGLTAPLLTIADFTLSWRDVILGAGGLFLLYKGTREIHAEVEGRDDHGEAKVALGMAAAITQIMILDAVFSLDSVITAVGMTSDLPVMVAAVVFAILVMLFAAEPVAAFIHKHPTTKMLALSFLLLVGVALVADGLHFHIPRGYLYFAIFFSLTVEVFNLVASNRRKKLRAVEAAASGEDQSSR
ncbi:TerC family protein [Iodidimonas nitroreducens]|uniref:TerC family protein n=1 Tax=Iodidimonas nitroreducens TaxID=1236968 RepID=UPI0005A6B1E6